MNALRYLQHQEELKLRAICTGNGTEKNSIYVSALLEHSKVSLLIVATILLHKTAAVPQRLVRNGLRLNHSHTALISLLDQILAMH